MSEEELEEQIKTEHLTPKEIMNLRVKDLMEMVLQKGGTVADFTFKDENSDEIMAFISISLFETAAKLKEIFYNVLEELDIEESEEEAQEESADE